MEKSKIVGKIIELTKNDPTVYFDKLIEKDEKYLVKLLKICNALQA